MNDDEYQRLEKLTDRELFDFMTETDASQRMWVARHLLELRRNRTMDNMAEDVADCVAHFTIISVEASSNAKTQRSKEWADIEARYRVSATNAIALLRATMTGKPEKFMQAKIDLRMQQKIKILKSEGTDRLMVLHADSCKELMENPQERLKYWTDKE